MADSSSQTFLRELDKKPWTAADKLRSNLNAAVYKHAVLGLIFQDSAKLPPGTEIFLGKGAQASRLFLRNEKNTGKMPMLSYKITSTGKLIDNALEAIEKENPNGTPAPLSTQAKDAAGATSLPAHRNREGETLFTDARKIGAMISRTQKELLADDIAAIAKTYHAWRGETKDGAYADVAGSCKSATLEDIRKHDYVLTPGRYVGAADIEDDGIPFETKMTEMSQTLYGQIEESAKLDEVIRKNLEGLGYGR